MPKLDKATAIVWLAAIVALIVFAMVAWHEWGVARTAKVETRLATGQAGAALASGQDSANTIGNRMDADAAGDTIHRENADANDKAEGGNVVVAAPATDTGVAGLCRHAAYRRDPRCLQHRDPR